MAEPEFTIDMSKSWRKTKRSKRDIRRFWNSRYSRFTKAGFTDEEAIWAANEGLSPRHKRVRDILNHRKGVIHLLTTYDGLTREEAIEQASKELEYRLDRANEDEPNLFYEVSP